LNRQTPGAVVGRLTNNNNYTLLIILGYTYPLASSTTQPDACLRRHDGNSLINFRIIAVHSFVRTRRHPRVGGNLFR